MNDHVRAVIMNAVETTDRHIQRSDTIIADLEERLCKERAERQFSVERRAVLQEALEDTPHVA